MFPIMCDQVRHGMSAAVIHAEDGFPPGIGDLLNSFGHLDLRFADPVLLDCGDLVDCTEHGIAATAARMAKVVLNDEKTIMPASAPLDGEYGERNVFAGVPCRLGKDGIERILELPLTPDEKAVFHDCCESIRQNIAKAETFGEYKA